MENTFMVPWITLHASKNSPIASRKKNILQQGITIH